MLIGATRKKARTDAGDSGELVEGEQAADTKKPRVSKTVAGKRGKRSSAAPRPPPSAEAACLRPIDLDASDSDDGCEIAGQPPASRAAGCGGASHYTVVRTTWHTFITAQ